MTLAMASSEGESESKYSLDIIDSVHALISTARPDAYSGYFDHLGSTMWDFR
jgi:hypothetical protein